MLVSRKVDMASLTYVMRVDRIPSTDTFYELLHIPFSGADLDIQCILFGGKSADEFVIISTRGLIGHIEIQNHLIPIKDFGIDVPSPIIKFLPIGLVLERDEKDVTQDRLVNFDHIVFAIQFKMKLSIPDITFIGPFVGEEGGIVLRVVNMEDVTFDVA